MSDSEATAVRPDQLPSLPPLDDESPFATMMSQFDDAARRLGLPEELYSILRKPDREMRVAVPVRLDNGKTEVLDGFRVQHHSGLGPTIGPMILSDDIRVDDLRALAGWMTWKCGIMNIPFGGAAGALTIDPQTNSRNEIERSVRRYTAAMLDIIGPDRDIFAGDLSSDLPYDDEVMAWVMDTVSVHNRYAELAVVTGKPDVLGGNRGQGDAVAQGLRVILKLAIDHFGQFDHSPSVVIQGAGKVGGNLARLLHVDGYRVCGISDVKAAFYNPKGLDIPAILRWREEHGTLSGCTGEFEELDSEDFLASSCDVLVPCAVANAITSRNVSNVSAKLIVEGAHGPVSARADRELHESGVQVVPDILANAGGVVTDYFEWVQNRQGMSWMDVVLAKRLKRFMTEAWEEVVKLQASHEVRLRMAANMLAVDRVSSSDKLRGIYA